MRPRLRTVIAACVFLSVIAALGFVIGAPARYFSATNVRTDMDCHVSHCNRESPDMNWRLTGLRNPDTANH
jgi:hypothetical protein